jgi:hypothetical protein
MKGARIILAAALLLLASCGKDPAKWVLFPDAVRVRTLGAPTADTMSLDKSGRMTAVQIVDKNAVEAPIVDGGWLSDSEIADLRKAVRITEPPINMAGCCFPRHAFLFYDRSGRYLGHLDVCFECGCARIEPDPPSSRKLNWISWDSRVLTRLVMAHHLGPLTPPRPDRT